MEITGAACTDVFKTPFVPTAWIGTITTDRCSSYWSNASKPHSLTWEIIRCKHYRSLSWSAVQCSFHIEPNHISWLKLYVVYRRWSNNNNTRRYDVRDWSKSVVSNKAVATSAIGDINSRWWSPYLKVYAVQIIASLRRKKARVYIHCPCRNISTAFKLVRCENSLLMLNNLLSDTAMISRKNRKAIFVITCEALIMALEMEEQRNKLVAYNSNWHDIATLHYLTDTNINFAVFVRDAVNEIMLYLYMHTNFPLINLFCIRQTRVYSS